VEDKFDLAKFKQLYKPMQVKYGLPEFEKLNEDFEIEKAADNETDFVLREVRKYIADKVINYFRFLESILNPSSSPSLFIFSISKTLNGADKEKMVEIYKKLARVEVQLMELDVGYSEEKEAKFINETYILWQEIKKELKEIVDIIRKNWDNKAEDNSKGYFG